MLDCGHIVKSLTHATVRSRNPLKDLTDLSEMLS